MMSFGSVVYAETKVGIDWMYGEDSVVPNTWQSSSCENTVNRFSGRIETNELFPTWNKWFFGAELQYSTHKSYNIRKDIGEINKFREHGLNVTIKRQMFDTFYLGWIMGISYWHSRDNGVHNLGDSHWLGTWGPMIGKDWKLPYVSDAWSLRTEIRLTHTSDPFESDSGKNYGTGVVGISYNF
jgi:hypothetical protein